MPRTSTDQFCTNQIRTDQISAGMVEWGMPKNHVSVERTITAAPETIFAYLSDATKHQEIDGSGTLRGAKGDPEPLALGSTFGMSMHMGASYSTVNEVVEYEQDRRIAWKTTGLGGVIGGRIWRYELEPVEGGTLVRETWDISTDKQRLLLRLGSMPTNTGKAMTKTLKQIAGLVEGH